MVGTANSTVARVPTAACTRSAAENLDRMCTVPPAIRAVCSPPSPCWWYSGSACTSTSSGCHCQAAIAARIETATWRWVSGTPLGLPVVPEVYASSATSCGRAAIAGAGPASGGSSPTSTVIRAGSSPASRCAGSRSAKASLAPESAAR